MPIAQEDDIQDNEFILRRIPNSVGYIISDDTEPVNRISFKPTDQDGDGISLYRELFASAKSVAEAGNNKNGYYVVRMTAQSIRELGLEIVPNPICGELPGHSLIPDLNCNMNKNESKALQLKLADLVNEDFQNSIVFTP